jgi:hypothetical protein
LRRRLRDLDEQLVRLTRGFADEVVPRAAYEVARDELAGERESVAGVLRGLEEERRRRPARSGPVVRRLLASWETAPVLARRELLRSLLRAVVVHRGERRGDVWVEVVPL